MSTETFSQKNARYYQILVAIFLLFITSISIASSSLPEADVDLILLSRFSQRFDEEPLRPNDKKSEFEVQNATLFGVGKIDKNWSFLLSAEFNDPNGDTKMLDSILQYRHNDALNIWAGQLPMPTDRTNLSGSPNRIAYDFPGAVRKIPGIIRGRDKGLVVWGLLKEQRLKYYLGAFEGVENTVEDTNNNLFTARLSWHLQGKEPSFFDRNYHFRPKPLSAISGSCGFQEDATSQALDVLANTYNSADYHFCIAEVFTSQPFTSAKGRAYQWAINAAYHHYDTGNQDMAPFLIQGNSQNAEASLAVKQKEGDYWWQPHISWQNLDADFAQGYQQLDFGLHMVNPKKKRRFTFTLSEKRFQGSDAILSIKLGVQMLFFIK